MDTNAAKKIFEKLRVKRGISQRKLSIDAGLNPMYVNQWIKILQGCDSEKLKKMLAILDYTWPQFEAMVAAESGQKAATEHSSVTQNANSSENFTIERKFEVLPLPTYQLVSADTLNAVPVKCWQNLACGYGADLELCDDPKYLMNAPRGVVCVIVRGDSMEPAVSVGDVLLMREMEYILPSLDVQNGEIANVRYAIQQEISQNGFYVVSLNNDPPMLKRIRFVGRNNRWHMLIISDNQMYEEIIVEKTDRVTFWAKIVGRAK